MRSKTIKIPLYFQKLKVCVVAVLEKPEYDSYVEFEKDRMVVYVKPDTSAGVVAHEAVHIANYVFKQCNIAADLDNDEPYAYLIGWIVEQISKVITNHLTDKPGSGRVRIESKNKLPNRQRVTVNVTILSK